MNLDGLNLDSLGLSNTNEKSSGKPPLQPNSNLVNIGPFTIQKLNISEGFYTNPAQWSKSSTGSGHTEHEEDSQYRLERLEYLNTLSDSGRHVSPSVQIAVENEDFKNYGVSFNKSAYEGNYSLDVNRNDMFGSSRSTPTAASQQQQQHQQQQQQHQQMLNKQSQLFHLPVQQKYQDNSSPSMSNPSPRNLLHNPYAPQPPSAPSTVPRSPHSYEYDGTDLTSYSDSRSHRSNMPHYTPSAAVSAAAWRPSVTSATASSMQLRTTPTHHGGNKYSSGGTPPVSPANSAGYYAQYSMPQGGAVNGLIYQVQFKCAVKNFILGSQAHPNIAIGDFVVVEADRGEDIGIVTEILPMKTFVERRIYMKTSADDENVIGRIIRQASVAERQFLPEKFHDEENIVQFCRELACTTYHLPMMIHDVEYQFDRHKLTIYYTSEARVDFREFVRDLFSAYKARIWMKKVPAGKPTRFDNWASVAVATGMQFAPDAK